MDPTDLLYTNVFSETESLSKEELQKNANNFLPYRTLKSQSVNNVRDTVERTVFTNNPIVDRENKAYGWNRGGLANQDPVLSDFARDIGESTYYRYKTTYLNIDSRMRDYSRFPRPNNYQVFLGRKFDNVESIKLIDYFFPDAPFPINKYNNNLVWFNVPYEMFNKDFGVAPFLPFTSNLEIFSWITNFNNFINLDLPCRKSVGLFRNRILNCFNNVVIPEGYYTVKELEKTIEDRWKTTVFYHSGNVPEPFITDEGSPTKDFIDKAQLVKVNINPVTSEVSITLRYEEFRIDMVRSYLGKTYIDIRLKSEDPLVPSEEFKILLNNNFFPLIPTGIPQVGGISETKINRLEFCSKEQRDVQLERGFTGVRYFDFVKNPDTGEIIPNIIRLFLETTDGFTYKCSSNEVLKVTDPCNQLCDAVIGREAVYILIKGTASQLFSFLKSVGNNSGKLIPACFSKCAEFPEENPNLCKVLSDEFIELFNYNVVNEDCSNKLITNMLGFLNTDNSLAQLGPASSFAFAINTNNIYRPSLYVNSVYTIRTQIEQAKIYANCELKKNGINPYIQFEYVNLGNEAIDFKLPICKNSDGSFSFYFDNYMFLKLLNPVLSNQLSGSEMIQVRSTSSYGGGSNDRYIYENDKVTGFSCTTIDPPPDPEDGCFNLLPSLYPNQEAGTLVLNKNVENLFAKIKFSGESGSCNVTNAFTNELIYFDSSVVNLDNFVVQLIDYQGRILQSNKEHSFTLMIVEKIEVLKESAINSRKGFSNSVGIQQVQRNSFNR